MASAFDWDLRKRIENRYTATNLLSVCVCIPYPIARFKRTRALRLFDTESFIKSVTANISARLRVARQFPSCNLDTGKKGHCAENIRQMTLNFAKVASRLDTSIIRPRRAKSAELRATLFLITRHTTARIIQRRSVSLAISISVCVYVYVINSPRGSGDRRGI